MQPATLNLRRVYMPAGGREGGREGWGDKGDLERGGERWLIEQRQWSGERVQEGGGRERAQRLGDRGREGGKVGKVLQFTTVYALQYTEVVGQPTQEECWQRIQWENIYVCANKIRSENIRHWPWRLREHETRTLHQDILCNTRLIICTDQPHLSRHGGHAPWSCWKGIMLIHFFLIHRPLCRNLSIA